MDIINPFLENLDRFKELIKLQDILDEEQAKITKNLLSIDKELYLLKVNCTHKDKDGNYCSKYEGQDPVHGKSDIYCTLCETYI